jgi:hypothetical protein
MNHTTVPEPYRIILDRPYRHAFVAAASLLLTFWAIYLDPVINVDGIDHVHGAQYFLQGEWSAGFHAGGTLYSMLVALVSLITGLSVPHAAYALSACFHVLLVLGFIAVVGALGGGRGNMLVLAAAIILLYPALNALRSHITGDMGYWACIAWALAWFMHCAGDPNQRSLHACVGWSAAALLFGFETLVFLMIVPVWWWVHGSSDAARPGGGGKRLLKIPVVIAGAGLVGCYALWQEAWQSGIPLTELLSRPLGSLADQWNALGEALRFKLEALRTGFLDEHSQKYDDAALLMTVLWLCIGAVVAALGALYSGAVVYALVSARRTLSCRVRYWWSVVAVTGLLLIVAKVIAGLSATSRDAMTLALVLLTVVPPAVEHLWQSRTDARGARRWVWPAVLVLLLANGIHGMEPRTDRHHLREAGLWLRANAKTGDSLYTDNPIIAYYSGLEGGRRPADYSWREAMNKVQRNQWSRYDYLALEIPRAKPHREGMLRRYLDIEPIRTFSGDGGRVLVFASGD